VANISIVPSDTPSSAPLVAGELLFAHTPTPLIYASNRDDPSAQGDAIAIFDINPLTKVAEVRTGLQHLRGVAFVGENNGYLIAGGMKGGGIKIYESFQIYNLFSVRPSQDTTSPDTNSFQQLIRSYPILPLPT